MTKALLLGSAAALAFALPALAQTEPRTADAAISVDATPVSEVVVTATRLPIPITDTPGARVVTDEQIERLQLREAADVLRLLPGVSFSRTGAFGGVAAVRLRGTSSDKALVLIDGVPQNDPSSPAGGYDFSVLDLADVSRVELLSGPQGSLWGSDAVGGVISFTTRELDGVRAFGEAGSFNTFRGSAAIGGSDAVSAFGASISGLTTDGISKADERDGAPEDDGFDTWTASANGRYALSDRITVDARVRYVWADAEIDGFPAPSFTLADTDETSLSRTWTGFARVRVADLGGLDHAVSISGLDLERETRGGDFPSAYDAQRTVFRWQAERNRAGEAISYAVGAEREDTRARLSDGTEADLGATSVFGVLRWTATDRLTLTGSLRYDDPDSYDGEGTARVAAAYDLGSGFTASASFGQGFKTPTISQTACDFCFPAGPSLNLRPERARGYDARLAWASADRRFAGSVTAWRIDVRDQIDFAAGPAFSFRYANIDRTRSYGAEVEGSAVLGAGFELRGQYSWTDAIDRSTGAQLLRIPEHQAAATLQYARERWDAAFTLRAEGDQADAGGERDGFVVADLAAGFRLNDSVRLTARVENLLDERYQEALGYGEPGRSAYVGITIRQ